MTEILSVITSPLWAYVMLGVLLAADAFVPVLPTQAIMITGGVLAATGELSLPTTIAVGTAGVLCGDVAWYLIGRLSPPLSGGSGPANRWTRTWAGRRARGWAQRLGGRGPVRAAARLTRGLRRPGPLVILVCRFVPGGRMAACLHAGRARYPQRQFLTYASAAALGWSTYGGLVGQLGGAAVTRSAWLLIVIAALAATLFATTGWLLALARPQADPAKAPPAPLPAPTRPAPPLVANPGPPEGAVSPPGAA